MSLDLVVSFDSTGSMNPVIAEVRRRVTEMIDTLFDRIPDLRIGIIAHGDYCDEDNPYTIKEIQLTKDKASLIHFVETVEKTDGGDPAECYELVLHHACVFDWRADNRVFVLIADDQPHAQYERQNYLNLNWREEAKELAGKGVTIYAVKALNTRHHSFYKELAEIGNGVKLPLNQFNEVVELISAICYKQQGDKTLQSYEQELVSSGRMNRSINAILDKLYGKSVTRTEYYGEVTSLDIVPPGRFQLLHVDHRISIKQFVLDAGAEFKTGRGFYQLTKPVLVQERKEVVLRDKKSGDMFTGAKAREMIGLPYGERGRIKFKDIEGYDTFIQSTSYNRILLSGTFFLYEVA